MKGGSTIKDRTGATSIASNGMQMTIIAYRKYNDIDVQFSDGEIVYHKAYKEFKNGYIKHPSSPTCKMEFEKRCESRVGETNIANNGLTMTIIAYRHVRDIDVEFSNGVIREHVTYNEFKRGSIGDPNINTHVFRNQKRVGETNVATNGLRMTILSYRRSDDIDIKFEDGQVVYHKAYSGFKTGRIEHPFVKSKKFRSDHHIGETKRMKNGLNATILKADKSVDITVLFENDMKREHVSYSSFCQGYVALPNIHNIHILQFAYIYENQWYYICSRHDWQEEQILSVQEMYDYVA